MARPPTRPLVAERLPVTVPAAETTEGHARLYEQAHARDRAADVLRSATRTRLAPLIGVSSAHAHTADVLLPALHAHLASAPAPKQDSTPCSSARLPRTTEPWCTWPTNSTHSNPRSFPKRGTPLVSTPTADSARTSLEDLRTEIAKAVVGQDPAVTGLVVALLCRGHVLLEGAPGVAKTLLVRALSAALELDTKRVQFTPDLMPSDVTGSLVYDARSSEFSFQPGPVFTNLLLADEINRTPPKTQASLLEAMEERQVTVDGTARPLPSRSWWRPRRTPWNTRAPIRSPKLSSTASC